jgi:hypothetical protein
MYIYNNNDCMQNKGAQFNERRSEKQDDDGAAVSIRVREEHMRYIPRSKIPLRPRSVIIVCNM